MISPALPSQFCLQDLAAITGRVCELRVNRYQAEADREARTWFDRFVVSINSSLSCMKATLSFPSIGLYDDRKKSKFLNYGKFDLFAALSFPDADLKHLVTCLIFFFWAFSTDDLSDEGDLQSRPDDVQAGHEVSVRVVNEPGAPRPEYPYAAMFYDLLQRFRETSTPGAYKRFIRAWEEWSGSQVTQSRNRSQDRIPSVDEFILMRRATIGGAMVEAIVEYSLDLDLPDEDLCSFN
ncbi:isoprenoid synthase domain-containing protein, partial [Pisolithus marmoratus]